MRISSPAVVPLAALLLSGCFVVYQPLTGLQRPVAVDPGGTSFKGLRLQLSCIPSDYLEPDDAELLCQRAGKLLTQQGAIVKEAARAGSTDDERDPSATLSALAGATPTPDLDLKVELTARQVHEDNSVLLWTLSFLTLTLAPAISEYTFEQNITVRDASGFLLASEIWQGRLVQYFGLAIWAVNFLLDHTLRKPADRLTGNATEQDFSRDYYRQLTQLVFNARSRLALLKATP